MSVVICRVPGIPSIIRKSANSSNAFPEINSKSFSVFVFDVNSKSTTEELQRL